VEDEGAGAEADGDEGDADGALGVEVAERGTAADWDAGGTLDDKAAGPPQPASRPATLKAARPTSD